MRWALPILFVVIQKGSYIRKYSIRMTFIAGVLAAMALLYRIQYRNAAFPTIFVLLGPVIPRQRLRDILSLLSCISSIACPIAFCSRIYQTLAIGFVDILPTNLPRMFDFDQMIRLSGRFDLWSAYIDEFSNI